MCTERAANSRSMDLHDGPSGDSGARITCSPWGRCCRPRRSSSSTGSSRLSPSERRSVVVRSRHLDGQGTTPCPDDALPPSGRPAMLTTVPRRSPCPGATAGQVPRKWLVSPPRPPHPEGERAGHGGSGARDRTLRWQRGHGLVTGRRRRGPARRAHRMCRPTPHAASLRARLGLSVNLTDDHDRPPSHDHMRRRENACCLQQRWWRRPGVRSRT